MRRKKAQKANAALATLILAAALLSGCGSSSQTAFMSNRSMATGAEIASMDTAENADSALFRTSENSAAADEASAGDNIAETDAADSTTGNEASSLESDVQKESVSEKAKDSRKLITTVDLSVQTREFEKLQKNIEETVTVFGGYIESSTVYNNNYWSSYDTAKEDLSGSRSTSYTLRVPEKRLDEFLEKLHDGANVTRESRSVEDITLEYVDIASRKRALETEAESLEKMMEKATELSDIIQIQSELTDVRYQIDSIESQLRTYDNQVDYSTVNLDVDEVRIYTQPANASVWEKISTGFMESLRNVGNGIMDAAVWIIVHIPQIVLAAVILIIAVLAGRKIGKKMRGKIRNPWRRRNKSKNCQEKPEDTEENGQECDEKEKKE